MKPQIRSQQTKTKPNKASSRPRKKMAYFSFSSSPFSKFNGYFLTSNHFITFANMQKLFSPCFKLNNQSIRWARVERTGVCYRISHCSTSKQG